jgi:catechol 2,3-dioxygenase-like lactoylglutathione lyase family enzyme
MSKSAERFGRYGTIARLSEAAAGRGREDTRGMAYRFLLEVPESLAEAATIAVERVGDTQVLVARPSHGRPVDDPYLDLTVAAHSLRVIDSLYDWFDDLGASRPDIRIVLHGGERHALEAIDRGRMVAMIRRDQPWVERTIPKVGEHEPTIEPAGYSTGPGVPSEALSVDALAGNAPVAVVGAAVVDGLEPAASVNLQGINYVMVQVNDLPKAEAFYQEFFGMKLLGRVRSRPDGQITPLPQDYSWQRAIQTGELADVSFLSNGAVTLAVRRLGLAARIGTGAVEMVSLGVDTSTFHALKGQALMRPLTVLRSDVASFVFKDPFNVTWEIAVVGSVPLIPV